MARHRRRRFRTLNELLEVQPTSGIRSTLGAGTNQDEVFLIALSQVTVHVSPVTLQVFPEVGSGTATVRYQARRYVALVAEQPGAIAHITGTGLAAPTW